MYTHIGNIDRFRIVTPTYHITDIDNDKIASEVLLSSKRLNDNILHTFYEDFHIDFKSMPETKKLYELIDEIAEKNIKKSDNIKINLSNCWAHIHKPFESTGLHNHYPSGFSFVYYVKMPAGAGKFYFSLTGRGSVSDSIPVEGHEGMLMFFDSWIDHAVTKNLSDDYRISLSGNYDIEDIK